MFGSWGKLLRQTNLVPFSRQEIGKWLRSAPPSLYITLPSQPPRQPQQAGNWHTQKAQKSDNCESWRRQRVRDQFLHFSCFSLLTDGLVQERTSPSNGKPRPSITAEPSSVHLSLLCPQITLCRKSSNWFKEVDDFIPHTSYKKKLFYDALGIQCIFIKSCFTPT